MTRDEMVALVAKYAQQHQVDPGLVARLIQAESSWDPTRTSPAGAQGLMQLMPATAKELGVSDAYDPEQNIAGGVRYLAQMMKQFDDPRQALAAYNFGPGNVSRGLPWPAETRNYVDRIYGTPDSPALDYQLLPGTPAPAAPETREQKRARIMADPDWVRFTPEQQQRILSRTLGDVPATAQMRAARPGEIRPEPSTMPEAFERLMAKTGISGVMDRLLGKAPENAPPSATPTLEEKPFNETDTAALIQGAGTAMLPMALPEIGAATGASLLKMLGLSVPLTAAGGALGEAGGEKLGIPETGKVIGEFAAGAMPGMGLRARPTTESLTSDLASRVLGALKVRPEPPPEKLAQFAFRQGVRAALEEARRRAAAISEAQRSIIDSLGLRMADERMALADRGPVRGKFPAQPAAPEGPRVTVTPQEAAVEGQVRLPVTTPQGTRPASPERPPAEGPAFVEESDEGASRRIAPLYDREGNLIPGRQPVMDIDNIEARRGMTRSAQQAQDELAATRARIRAAEEAKKRAPVVDRDFAVPEEGTVREAPPSKELAEEAPRPPVAASEATSGTEQESAPTARISGEDYRAGDVIKSGPHKGKVVESIEPGGVPVVRKMEAPAAVPPKMVKEGGTVVVDAQGKETAAARNRRNMALDKIGKERRAAAAAPPTPPAPPGPPAAPTEQVKLPKKPKKGPVAAAAAPAEDWRTQLKGSVTDEQLAELKANRDLGGRPKAAEEAPYSLDDYASMAIENELTTINKQGKSTDEILREAENNARANSAVYEDQWKLPHDSLRNHPRLRDAVPEALPAPALRTPPAGARIGSFKEFVEASGGTWPIKTTDPLYEDLKFAWDGYQASHPEGTTAAPRVPIQTGPPRRQPTGADRAELQVGKGTLTNEDMIVPPSAPVPKPASAKPAGTPKAPKTAQGAPPAGNAVPAPNIKVEGPAAAPAPARKVDVLNALGIRKPTAPPAEVAAPEVKPLTAKDVAAMRQSLEGLDELRADDAEYRDLLPQGLQGPLAKGETWRGRVVSGINRASAKPAAPAPAAQGSPGVAAKAAEPVRTEAPGPSKPLATGSRPAKGKTEQQQEFEEFLKTEGWSSILHDRFGLPDWVKSRATAIDVLRGRAESSAPKPVAAPEPVRPPARTPDTMRADWEREGKVAPEFYADYRRFHKGKDPITEELPGAYNKWLAEMGAGKKTGILSNTAKDTGKAPEIRPAQEASKLKGPDLKPRLAKKQPGGAAPKGPKGEPQYSVSRRRALPAARDGSPIKYGVFDTRDGKVEAVYSSDEALSEEGIWHPGHQDFVAPEMLRKIEDGEAFPFYVDRSGDIHLGGVAGKDLFGAQERYPENILGQRSYEMGSGSKSFQEFAEEQGFGSLAEGKTHREFIDDLTAQAHEMAKKWQEPQYSTAYHGSRSDFDKFDKSKIGTGQGAASYGHGLYFASKKEVAEHYRETLSGASNLPMSVLREYFRPGRVIRSGIGGDYDQVVSFNKTGEGDFPDWSVTVQAIKDGGNGEWVKDPRFPRERTHVTEPLLQDVEKSLGRKIRLGKTYEVELAPKEDEYLDWDKPLSQQSDHVKKALQWLVDNEPGAKWLGSNSQDLNGGAFYNELGHEVQATHGHTMARPDVYASATLKSAGIPGIRYLDQGSRGTAERVAQARRELPAALEYLETAKRNLASAKEHDGNVDFWVRHVADRQKNVDAIQDRINNVGTHNYVIFDDKDISIKNKYSAVKAAGAEDQVPPMTLQQIRANLPQKLAEDVVQAEDGSFYISTPRGDVTIQPTGEIELNWHALEAGHGAKTTGEVRSGLQRVVGSSTTIGPDQLIQIVEEGALPHEIGHYFLDHFATPAEHTLINRSLQKAADAEGRRVAEVFGDGFSDWFQHDRELRGSENTLQRIYRRIYEFFDGIYRTFRPNLEGVYRDVARGKVFRRNQLKPVDTEAASGYDSLDEPQYSIGDYLFGKVKKPEGEGTVDESRRGFLKAGAAAAAGSVAPSGVAKAVAEAVTGSPADAGVVKTVLGALTKGLGVFNANKAKILETFNSDPEAAVRLGTENQKLIEVFEDAKGFLNSHNSLINAGTIAGELAIPPTDMPHWGDTGVPEYGSHLLSVLTRAHRASRGKFAEKNPELAAKVKSAIEAAVDGNTGPMQSAVKSLRQVIKQGAHGRAEVLPTGLDDLARFNSYRSKEDPDPWQFLPGFLKQNEDGSAETLGRELGLLPKIKKTIVRSITPERGPMADLADATSDKIDELIPRLLAAKRANILREPQTADIIELLKKSPSDLFEEMGFFQALEKMGLPKFWDLSETHFRNPAIRLALGREPAIRLGKASGQLGRILHMGRDFTEFPAVAQKISRRDKELFRESVARADPELRALMEERGLLKPREKASEQGSVIRPYPKGYDELYKRAVELGLDNPEGRALYALSRKHNSGGAFVPGAKHEWDNTMTRAKPETAQKWLDNWNRGGSVRRLLD